METQSLELREFSGGLTDHAISGKINQYVRAENILLDELAKPYSRPGSVIYDAANAQLPTGNQRVGALINFDKDTALLAQSARRLYRYSAGWQEITGPSSNPALGAGATSNRVTFGEWKSHLFITNDATSLPMKIYRDNSGNYQVRNAGLPKFVTADPFDGLTTAPSSITSLANDIRTQFLDHYADTTRHPVAADTASAALITSGALTAGVSTLAQTITLVSQLMAAYKNHYVDAIKPTGSRAYHSNSLGVYPGAPNCLLSFETDPETFLEVAQVLNDIKRKFNWHMRAFRGHPSVGPDLITASTIASTEEGPLFSTSEVTILVTLANEVKSKFNRHLTDTTATLGESAHVASLSPGGALDTENTISLANASDKDSLIELVCHLYAAYRRHNDDAAEPVFVFRTTTTNGSPTVGIPDDYSTYAGNYGKPTDIEVGMYAFSGNNLPAGTTVLSKTLELTSLRMTVSANATVTASTEDGAFTNRRWHIGNYDSERAATDTNASQKALEEFTFDQIAADFGDLFDCLYDIATKFNLHDAESDTHYAVSISGGYNQINLEDYDDYEVRRYVYAFAYSNEYTLYSGEIFKDVSTPYYKQYIGIRPIEEFTVGISSLPTIANGSTGNYATSAIKIEIYRTENNGITPRLVGRVTNGTTTFSDNVGDTELAGLEAIYTDGGVVDNDPPPYAKYLHITSENFAYYGDIQDGTEYFPNRIRQAIQNDPDSCPATFYVDLPDRVMGISSVKGLPIGFTRSGHYRLEGFFDELGRGSIRPITISDSVGTLCPWGIVQVDGGVVFPGTDGFYFTDGYRSQKLSDNWNTTYQTLISTSQRQANIVGSYDRLNQRVYWCVTNSGTENNLLLVLDLRFGVKPDAVFTTALNGSYFAPTSVCFFNNQLIRGDSRGYVLKHDSAYTTDPKIDTGVAASSWLTKAITYSHKTVAFDFGTTKFKKLVSSIVTQFENNGDLSVQIKSYNDFKSAQSLAPIRARSVTGLIEELRKFRARGLRCSVKQVEFTNAEVVIESSETKGTATVNSTANTVTLDEAATYDWAASADDYVIAFADDDYENEFTILSQTADVLTVSDPSDLLPASGSYDWVIRGVPKGEKFKLFKAVLKYQVFGQTQSDAGAGESGEP